MSTRAERSSPRTAPEPVEVKLAARGLCAYFGATQVLADIDLSIPSRRVTAIIGPSGCGKTTLVRCLNRLHEVTPGARVAGAVLFDGADIYAPNTDPSALRRRIGMVFQRPNLFPSMSIRDNLLTGPRLAGAPAVEEDGTVERVLRQVSLWDELKDSLGKRGTLLSDGQQQRLCIARMLALEPELILMDEPCATLDPIGTARVEELVHELRSRYAVVLVTHNMQQAARVADYTAFIYQGRVLEHGETDVVFTRPRHERTEEYITGRFG